MGLMCPSDSDITTQLGRAWWWSWVDRTSPPPYCTHGNAPLAGRRGRGMAPGLPGTPCDPCISAPPPHGSLFGTPSRRTPAPQDSPHTRPLRCAGTRQHRCTPPACVHRKGKGREGPSPARGWLHARRTASDNARLYVSGRGRHSIPGGAPCSSWLGVPHRLSKGPAIDLYECMEASWVASKGSAFLVQPAAPPPQDRNITTNAP